MEAQLEGTFVLPFLGDDLREYFPAVKASVNGQRLTARLDTGAPWLIMPPSVAEDLGLEMKACGKQFHGRERVQSSSGIAKCFELGAAIISDVPVVVLETVKRVIFGTNVLRQFLTTIDYPQQRIVLSPAGRCSSAKEHREMIRGTSVSIPFEIHDTHYMTATGSIGDSDEMTFFIDSGLVALRNTGKRVQQAALTGLEPADLGKLNIQIEDLGQKQFVELSESIRLGPLSQDGHLLWWEGEHAKHRVFERKEIHGLLGHAFLKNYAWTLDFERMKYVFTEPSAG